MTYRRLYLSLLLIGTVMLVGTWVYSLWWFSGMIVSEPRRTPLLQRGLVAVVHCGTLSVAWSPVFGGDHWIDFKSGPVTRINPGVQNGPMGKLFIGYLVEDGKRTDSLAIQFPLWFVYLVFAGSGYAIMRRGEKRSAASTEKALALQGAEGKPAMNPDTVAP